MLPPQYISKLDSSRAEDSESLKETAISLCAIDKLMGNEYDSKKEPDENEVTGQSQAGQAKVSAVYIILDSSNLLIFITPIVLETAGVGAEDNEECVDEVDYGSPPLRERSLVRC